MLSPETLQKLTDKEYRVYHTLEDSAVNGVSTLTQDQLAVFCNTTVRTVQRAIAGLSEKGLVRIKRTKRNYGFRHFNHYELVNYVAIEHDTSDVSTAVPVEIPVTRSIVIPTFNKTSFYQSGEAANLELKGLLVGRKWDEDDNVSGWGLMPDEVPSHLKAPPLKRSDPRTRDQRPREAWTPADVAAELSHRVWKILQDGQPNPINRNLVRNAVTKYRKESGLTALIELEIMDMFFDRGEAHRVLASKPQYVHSTYLRWLKTMYAVAKERLYKPADTETELNEATANAMKRMGITDDSVRA